MKKTNSVIETINYGSINLKLKEIMDAKKINRNQVAKAINSRFEIIDKWYKGDIVKMDLDILAKLCYVLECTPNDLIEYKK